MDCPRLCILLHFAFARASIGSMSRYIRIGPPCPADPTPPTSTSPKSSAASSRKCSPSSPSVLSSNTPPPQESATEHHWLQLFDRYLPKRYRAAPAFVIDSTGRRSRQIDIAIFDNLYTPPLFPHSAGLHLPAESVYAVFEVKPTFSRQWLRDAAEKAASVRSLRRTSVSVIGREGHAAPDPRRPPRHHLRLDRPAPSPPTSAAPATTSTSDVVWNMEPSKTSPSALPTTALYSF